MDNQNDNVVLVCMVVIGALIAYIFVCINNNQNYNNSCVNETYKNGSYTESNMIKPYTYLYKNKNFGQRYLNDHLDINVEDKISEETIVLLYYSESSKEYQKFKPIWDNLKQKFNNDKLVILIDIDCVKNRSICEKANIRYYPTLRFIRGSRVVEYPIFKNRTYDDMIYYLINNMI